MCGAGSLCGLNGKVAVDLSTILPEMQVKPYNVYVTVAYPPDTDTPGYIEENKTKVSPAPEPQHQLPSRCPSSSFCPWSGNPTPHVHMRVRV